MPRAFVVGNGPSLAQTPLEKMIGEVCFAVTDVHLIYDRTDWRPTHYVRAEEASNLEPEHWLEAVRAHLDLGVQIHCNDFFFRPRWGLEATENVHHFRACAHYGRHYDDRDCPHLWHPPVLCTFGSSVNVAVQLAAFQGYSPIYLVGCDLGYRDEGDNHFVTGYEHGREQPAQYANLDTLAAHMIAARTGQAEIYNATVGGSLEVYERVNLNELFE